MPSSQDDHTDSSSDRRSISPAPSLYSFSSSVDGRLMLRQAYGRTLNNQNDTYFLPADNEEHRRLDLQHQIITLALGGLYPAPNLVRRALAPRPGKTPAILDVGTGSGSWAIEMAQQFPHCTVVGVDLAPPRVDGDLPPNCRFEIDDANLGFSHYRESFDVIHARSISSGIRDYPQLLEEFAQALRPGGVVIVGDGDLQLYDQYQQPLAYAEQGTPGFSWITRIFFATYNAMKNRGGNIDCPLMCPTWLRAIDSFTDVGWHKIFIPIGPWRYADQRERVLAEMLREDCLRFISGMGPLLLSEGYLPESVEMMQREAAAELREQRVRVQSRWAFAWAVKKSP
ncbi:S-adenosyl-L-methionine-dependent methyltransferase [Dichomitus squalens]|uniref:S-adenosyl-L-methionine-dependent methyltransferase n=1 Tax=Dichomitus squalens TaxID=114155 RepID=A0A4Q9QCP6_9APHY|nr:S-adenosyl-L-methionine-dependent methyltransferase [Dichomitus squalens]TBU65543.1 S-adenosyl-L-methionine-dependent methyltransferase [Dichomitus squalens]